MKIYMISLLHRATIKQLMALISYVLLCSSLSLMDGILACPPSVDLFSVPTCSEYNSASSSRSVVTIQYLWPPYKIGQAIIVLSCDFYLFLLSILFPSFI